MSLGTPSGWERPDRADRIDRRSTYLPHRPVHSRTSQTERAPEGHEEILMSTGSKLLLFALAATFVAAGEVPTAKAAPRPALCTAGRFAVAGAPLLGPGGEAVVLANRTVALGTLCP